MMIVVVFEKKHNVLTTISCKEQAKSTMCIIDERRWK